ncbi:MAG TPA: bestrophin family ion channel [Puia sp.]
MIIRKKANWFKMLFIWRGSVLPQLLPRLSILFFLSIIIVHYRHVLAEHGFRLNPAPFTLFGIALALFLSFRNTASYERFMEGRRLWGSLVNTCRSLAIKAHTLIDPPNNPTPFINKLIALSLTLKHQLRQTDPGPDLDRLLPPDLAAQTKSTRWKPIFLTKTISRWVQSIRQEGKIDPIRQQSFDSLLNELSNIIGGCERIASTPLPFSYNVLIHRTVYVYCFLLPLGLADSLGWMTPIIVVFIAYTYAALEAIAEELEVPFGTDPNDLPLDTICRTIENSLLEIDERPLNPEPPLGDAYYLT